VQKGPNYEGEGQERKKIGFLLLGRKNSISFPPWKKEEGGSKRLGTMSVLKGTRSHKSPAATVQEAERQRFVSHSCTGGGEKKKGGSPPFRRNEAREGRGEKGGKKNQLPPIRHFGKKRKETGTLRQ